MHVPTGKQISFVALKALPVSEQAQYVEINGSPENLALTSQALAHYSAVTSADKSRRRAANKAARKSRRNNR